MSEYSQAPSVVDVCDALDALIAECHTHVVLVELNEGESANIEQLLAMPQHHALRRRILNARKQQVPVSEEKQRLWFLAYKCKLDVEGFLVEWLGCDFAAYCQITQDELGAKIQQLDVHEKRVWLWQYITQRHPEVALELRRRLPMPRPSTKDARHSPDFRSVYWFGQEYSFTANQAACVRLLWEAWENGTPELSAAALCESVELANDRLDLVFRKHPAWGEMIRPGHTKGSYRLSPPAAPGKSLENHG